MSSEKFHPFKDFQSDQIQRTFRKIFTAHYACRNADLNLTLVTGTTNAFIFQIINSLIESWGVHLTCPDCTSHNLFFCLCIDIVRSKLMLVTLGALRVKVAVGTKFTNF